MSSKLIDNKKRNHAAKVLKQLSQKGVAPETLLGSGARMSKPRSGTQDLNTELRDQYDVIRNDLLKLRDDLNKGYDMAKNLLSRKNLMRELLKSK